MTSIKTTLPVQILYEAVCVSFRTNWGRQQSISSFRTASYKEIVGQTGLFSLGITTDLEEGKLNSNPAVLHLQTAQSNEAVEYADYISAEE